MNICIFTFICIEEFTNALVAIPKLPKYQHTTNRLWGYILSKLTEARSIKSIAMEAGISNASIARISDSFAYGMTNLPSVISIVEFRGNSGEEKFQCIITDPKQKSS